MFKSVEAVIEKDGAVRLAEPIDIKGPCRAIVVILEGDSEAGKESLDSSMLSEAALAEDWNRPEEDEAWAHLQPAR